jgi:hypothetical protein
MPPRDARLCPALERALPGDSIDYTDYRVVRELREVLFGDGDWHPVTLRAVWRDRGGRWVAKLEWSIGGETWTEALLVDEKKDRAARP